LLSVEGIDVYYGNIQALRGVSLEVRDGEMVGLIGPNGAGKTTTLKTISGLLRPKGGTITFDGQELSKTQPQRIVEIGVAQVPEGRGLFPGLSVLENLKMGHFVRRRDGKLKERLDLVFQHFPRLAERKTQLAGTLSGGEQQMMVMGRALLSRPKLLLVDEPSLGLAPVIVQQLFHILADINKREGMAMLLVEQFVNLALRHTQRSYVLAKGEISLTGSSAELLKNSDLVSASYLGGEAAAGETNGAAKKKVAAKVKAPEAPAPKPEKELLLTSLPPAQEAQEEEETLVFRPPAKTKATPVKPQKPKPKPKPSVSSAPKTKPAKVVQPPAAKAQPSPAARKVKARKTKSPNKVDQVNQ
jgi:branched-chain amino acid transport system ATP-binding protein